MTDRYAAFQATADRLLADWKQGTVTITRTIQGTPDPETPWIPAPSQTRTYALDAVAKDVSTKYVDGSTIFATDLQVTASTRMSWIAVNGAVDGEWAWVNNPAMPAHYGSILVLPSAPVRYEPAPGDVMAIDGAGVNIVKTMRIPRAGTAVAWRFIVRG